MNKSLLELAAEIVQAQVSGSRMDAEAVETALRLVYNTLRKIQAAEAENRLLADEGEPVEETEVGGQPWRSLEPADSIQEDQVVCLECGAAFRQLTATHLRTHGLDIRSYKKKYGFTLKQPLSAKALTKIRSEKARARGLPANLRAHQARRRAEKAKTRSGRE